MKTSELLGAALDWAVAQLEGYVHDHFDDADKVYRDEDNCWYQPSTDWAQGGPIIQRERIRLDPRGVWVAGHDSSNDEYLGPTPLIAAMRCYVASQLGDEIELPEGLR